MSFSNVCESLLMKYLKTLYGEGNYSAWPHQREAWQKIYEYGDEKVILIKAPTASGKTECVIIPYLSQFILNDWFLAPGLIYVLPNKTLLFSQYERIKRLVNILCPGKKISIVADFGGIYPGKTFLFGDIVLTTLDAFFYGLIAKRTIVLNKDEDLGKTLFPVGNIATSLVVFDEVQMFQDSSYYTPRILGKVIDILYYSGVPTIIMTATMPRILEETILPSTIDYVEVTSSKVRRGEVIVHLRLDLKLLEFIQDSLEFQEILSRYRKILVVANTIGRAIQSFREIRAIAQQYGFEVDLIHSKLLEATRRERESKLERMKNSDVKYILVATQVAESGLDLDFDVILTELAPIDGLIQRVGRVARRKKEGVAFIFDVPDVRPYNDKKILDETAYSITQSRLDEALKDLKKTKDLLDNVFTEIPSLPDRLKNSFDKTRRSIESLSPFIDFSVLKARIRPELYITILLLEDVDFNDLLKRNDVIELHVPYSEVRKSHMNIQFYGYELENYPYLNFNDIALKVNVERSILHEEKVLLKICKVLRIYPQSLYLANPEYYIRENNYDLGLLRRGRNGEY